MSTLRAAAEARITALKAALVVEEAKLASLHPTLAALLDHPIDEIRAFFVSFGAKLWGHVEAPVVAEPVTDPLPAGDVGTTEHPPVKTLAVIAPAVLVEVPPTPEAAAPDAGVAVEPPVPVEPPLAEPTVLSAQQ